VGRLLITLLLCRHGVLREPLLYLSLYFKEHRSDYFDFLTRVRREGDCEAWLSFFVEGVREMADGAVTTARRLSAMAAEDRAKIGALGRVAGSALRVHQVLRHKSLGSIPRLMKETGLTAPTVTGALKAMERAGIVGEITGRKRNRLYSYERYLDILRQGMEA
jgi:Fic family protein